MSGNKEKGILYNVRFDTLELLSYKNKYRPFIGPKMIIDESMQTKIIAEQIRSFTLQHKGAMNSAIITGFVAGGFTGGIIGAIVAGGKGGLSTLSGVAVGFLVGGTVGGLVGYLIAKGKQRKITIEGNKKIFLNFKEELMQKAYINH